jgi:predicted RND superfamily exporter protein
MTCVLALTVGSLIKNGWVLGVTESVVLSVAVGMAVDFTVHYGHAYTHAISNSQFTKLGRQERVAIALTQMGPTITMGATTTLVAGCVLMLSDVLFYHNFGVFLVLCMFLSWALSTFYFMSILSILGPEPGSSGDPAPAPHQS